MVLEELRTSSYSVPVLRLSVGLSFVSAENCVNIISPINKIHCHVFYMCIIISTIFFFGQRQTN